MIAGRCGLGICVSETIAQSAARSLRLAARKGARLGLPISSSPSKRQTTLTGSAPRLQEGLDRLDVDEHLSFVVTRASPVDVVSTDDGLEGWRAPFLERFGRLDIVVTIDENRRTARRGPPPGRMDNGVTMRLDEVQRVRGETRRWSANHAAHRATSPAR